MKKIFFYLFLLFVAILPLPALTALPSWQAPAAFTVLGQANYTGAKANRGLSVSGNTLANPQDVFSDGARLYVADTGNNRVLIWNTTSPAVGQAADIVLGQSGMTSKIINWSGALAADAGPASAYGLNYPVAVFSNRNKIYVVDQGNSRVLIFNYNVLESKALFTRISTAGAALSSGDITNIARYRLR